ncbi:hypothetical protein EHQ12_03970 [Leptospira gomenensis]|uniref:Uncharacterized protein n=1 Tax=Leptospira gomenensis TaxID=2484974 RepID=A0A5F1YEV7_9LEPT|nr:hypothetical protein [Leptospira gomenensis]TGK36168.1 hypothetical protein EHQ17_04435 [Leptospira gomenensis]TGK42792.1 hypothetical protein EHQ07_14055 [Leptospira gomenensis]TGK42924.1 hypothetical protein EHQ12_03970 [Leptospira gomenensis]TGK54936.1 hypothetical protein EHQ13_18225 [Leptospira gomenensis]
MRKYLDVTPIFTFLLRSRLPALASRIYQDTVNANTPNGFILIQRRPGNVPDLYSVKHTTQSFNIIVQDLNEKLARQTAFKIYNAVREEFNLLLDVPASLLDSEGAGLPSTPPGIVPIRLARINPIDEPYSLGLLDKGFFQFSLNYNVTGRFLQP